MGNVKLNIMYNRFYTYLLFLALSFLVFVTSGCKKFLDEKSSQTLTIPSKVQDVQMLLDDWLPVNSRNPYSGVVSADEYFLTDQNWASLPLLFREMHIWSPTNFFPAGTNNDWALCYNVIYRANVVLEYLTKIPRTEENKTAWDYAKGHALFLRSHMFFQLLTIFSPAWDENTAATDLGIPLRTSPDFNLPSVRNSVSQCFNRILDDLKLSAQLMPKLPIQVLRPSKAAAYGLLARTSLYMRNYDNAYLYADSALQIYSTLINYNNPIPNFYNPAAAHPFSRFHPEVIFASNIGYPAAVNRGFIDTSLYQSYSNDDLRKTIFFTNTQILVFKGNYEGNENLFNGISTDELFLIRAECLARKNYVQEAMQDINKLLLHRYKTGTFSPLSAANSAEALKIILTERRKQLLFRGTRWQDIKRLNKEGANIILIRKLNNQTYTLVPNDLRYALPIPTDVLELTGMPDNPR